MQLNFYTELKKCGASVRPISVDTLWVNITRFCNQACGHCHVNASPERDEHMNLTVIDGCLYQLSQNSSVRTLDITGGAPELNPYFDYFVVAARKIGKNVRVRHNLTVVFDGNPKTRESKEYLPAFFAENQVEVIASLPHYTKMLTDECRGAGVFTRSIEAISKLNELGYGREATGLILNLVYNCDGPISPEERKRVESDFRRVLWREHGLVFNSLLCVTNMPINRYYEKLMQTDNYDNYMMALARAFNPQVLENLVCRYLVSVDYKGNIYDCDFNQMLNMQVRDEEPVTIFNFSIKRLLERKIRFGPHCFGCTAGGGSS